MLKPDRTLISPSLNVPASLKPTIQNLNGTEFVVPRRAPDGTTMLWGAVNCMTVLSPVATLAFLKDANTGSVPEGSLPAMVFNAIVRAFAFTEATRVPLKSGALDSSVASIVLMVPVGSALTENLIAFVPSVASSSARLPLNGGTDGFVPDRSA